MLIVGLEQPLPPPFRIRAWSSHITGRLWLAVTGLLLVMAGLWLEVGRNAPVGFAIAAGIALLSWSAGRILAITTAVVILCLRFFLRPAVPFGEPGAARWFWSLCNQFGIHLLLALLTAHLQRSRTESARFASRDPLTGLLNRDALLERLDSMLASRRQTDRVLTVACLDGDRFKELNDSQGHPEGDRCLQVTAEILRENLRGDDIIARMGGDEFVIVLAGAERGHVAAIIDRVLKGLRAGMAEAGWDVSYSIGVAIIGRPGRFSAEQAWQAADQAMYAAKRESGGNSVHCVECPAARSTGSASD